MCSAQQEAFPMMEGGVFCKGGRSGWGAAVQMRDERAGQVCKGSRRL